MPEDPLKEPRKTFPIASIIVAGSAIIAVILLIVPSLIQDDGHSPEIRAKVDTRSLCVALEAYYLDFNAYPPYAIGSQGINRHLPSNHPAYSQPTFRASAPEESSANALTTPFAYIRTIPRIRPAFQKSSGVYFSYYTTGAAFLVYCPGYDQRYDIDPFKDFAPDTLPTSPLLVSKTYDPTNGTKSAGDIWRTNRGGPR